MPKSGRMSHRTSRPNAASDTKLTPSRAQRAAARADRQTTSTSGSTKDLTPPSNPPQKKKSGPPKDAEVISIHSRSSDSERVKRERSLSPSVSQAVCGDENSSSPLKKSRPNDSITGGGSAGSLDESSSYNAQGEGDKAPPSPSHAPREPSGLQSPINMPDQPRASLCTPKGTAADNVNALPGGPIPVAGPLNGDQEPRGPLLHVSYYRCMLEYKANVPPKCAIVEAITDLPDVHRELLEDAPRWQKQIQWCTDFDTRLWTFTDFDERLPSVWLKNFLNKPYYGKDYANFSRFPPSEDVWRTEHDPAAFGKSGSFITDWEFRRGAVVNLMLGGVTTCNLVEPVIINDKVHRQICMHPMDGEWQRFVTMIGSVYEIEYVEFNSFKNAVVFGTKGVSCSKQNGNQPIGSRGKFANNGWSPSKRRGAVSSDNKDKKKWANTMWGNVEVPIYDGTGFKMDHIDWDNVQNMPRVSADVEPDSIVVVAHTTSLYGGNTASLNIQFAIKLA